MAEQTFQHHERGRGRLPKGSSVWRFINTYVFATDHKIIGLQFLFSSLIWFFVGGMLAMSIRWQLARPRSDMPIFGNLFIADLGGQISPEFYSVLLSLLATVMFFFVITPILVGAFGNYLTPLMIGAEGMAFPRLNMLSYWLMWPAFGFTILSFFAPGYSASSGWTSYPPLIVLAGSSPGGIDAQTFCVIGLLFVGISSLLGSINHVTTIIQMRAPGMTMFRLPVTIWGMFIASIMQVLTMPVVTAALSMQLSDRVLGTGFFLPLHENVAANVELAVSGIRQAMLGDDLFLLCAHPAVCTVILPIFE